MDTATQIKPADDPLRDITDIPYFAYVPGALAWGIFIGASVLSLYLLKCWLARREGSSALRVALTEFDQLRSRQSGPFLSKEQAAYASLVTKRFLGVSEALQIAHMSPLELEQVRETCDNLELKGLINEVLSLDQARYRPDGDKIIESAILARLPEILRSYEEEKERRKKEEDKAGRSKIGRAA
jgi:hypothetical protein